MSVTNLARSSNANNNNNHVDPNNTSSNPAATSSHHQQQQPQDISFKVLLAGDSSVGKTSFIKCTTQLLSTKPDVNPSLAATQQTYSYKIKTGAKLGLDVIDVGPSGEREILTIRRSLVNSLFVVFINLATVKQKVEKSLFGKRTDTAMFSFIIKQDLRKYINLASLANPHGCPMMVVGTHKDFLSHKDEPALQVVINELRNLTNQICSEIQEDSPPRCFGCFLVSCVDHTVFSENREGPKNIKSLWNFLCEIAMKLADRRAPSIAETNLKSSLNVLRHERGLRAVTLHDLFLYSLTQSFTKRIMHKSLRKRQSLGDLSITKVRRGGVSKLSIAMIDLPSLSRLLNSLDSLRNKLAVAPPLVTANSDGNNNNNSDVDPLSLTGTYNNNVNSNNSLGGAGMNSAASFNLASSTNLLAASQRPNAGAIAVDTKESSSTFTISSSSNKNNSIDEVMKQITSQEKRDLLTQHGIVTWELMGLLGAGLIGGRCTREEKASLFWQMTLCSGYFIPCVSTATSAADCLLNNDSFTGSNNNNNILNNHSGAGENNHQKNHHEYQSASSEFFNCSAFVCTIGTRRRIPTEALDSLELVQHQFHHLTRRIVFSPELQFSRQNLFALFIGRLVNISNVALLCSSHLFECGAWLRDRSLPSARLFIHVDGKGSQDTLTLKFVSSADTSVRAHAAFVIEVLHSIRAVFEDFEFHRIAKWHKGGEESDKSISSPKDKFASGSEDLSRLDLAFGS